MGLAPPGATKERKGWFPSAVGAPRREAIPDALPTDRPADHRRRAAAGQIARRRAASEAQ